MSEVGAWAHFREYSGSKHFEQDCEALALASEPHRYAWRRLLLEHLPEATARDLGERLEILVGNEPRLGERVEEAIRNNAVDRELLADAVGVGEYALLSSEAKTGPATLASVASREQLKTNLAERSVPDREIVVEKTSASTLDKKKEEKEEQGYMTMGE